LLVAVPLPGAQPPYAAEITLKLDKPLAGKSRLGERHPCKRQAGRGFPFAIISTLGFYKNRP